MTDQDIDQRDELALQEIKEQLDQLAAEQMLSSRKIGEQQQQLDQLANEAEIRWAQLQELRRQLATESQPTKEP